MAVSEQEPAAYEEWDPRPRPSWAEPELPPRTTTQRPVLVATLATLFLVLAIVAGSRGLRDLDAAQVPYAAVTVLLGFGLAHRYTLWMSSPATRRYLRLSRRTVAARPGPTAVPRALPRLALGHLGLRRLPGARSRGQRVARQLLGWGCLLAALIALPLSWGWFTCAAVGNPAGSGYQLRLWGYRLLDFDADGPVAWSLFHGLDLAALLVLAGAGYLLRLRNRAGERLGATRSRYGSKSGDGYGYGPLPLLALLTVAVTGLLLTFSALALHGGGYQFLAALHLASVVFTLLYLPFGYRWPQLLSTARTGAERARERS
ncbi:MFS transporter [Kitasatospora sp. NBC_01287]|uniref:MFS transporter n=1 Tax=Kitasatospora sp. NBC_01287 TaxID=2903573 RepID=UPI00225C42F0|nr:MFS transporter [Kitasatospora sp. NBC_01287]MCX4748838.1 MFS transporter [Kitasatospora sp. NBC_01287]